MYISRERLTRVIPLLLALAGMALYVRTAAPSVATIFDDSLEFQVVIPLLGVPHPPGYPLYTLVGYAWTHMFPLRDPAFRLNVLSAGFAGITLGVLGYTLSRLPLHSRWSWPLTLVLALAPTFWAEATIAEVYALHWALMAAFLWAGQALVEGRRPGRAADVLALIIGLGLAHHRMIVLLLPTAAYWMWLRRDALGPRRRWARRLVWMLGPLLLYAYIPLIGARVGSLDGTYENGWAGFWRWVMARDYRVFLTGNPFNVHRTAGDYVHLFVQEGGWVLLILALLGIYGAWRSGPFGRGVLLALFFHLAFAVHYRVTDIEVFFLPVVLLALFPAAWGLDRVGRVGAWMRWTWGYRVWAGVLLALVLLHPLKQTVHEWEVRDRSDDWAVYDVGRDMMRQPMPRGSAIVGLLGETTLVRYFRDVLGYRPDVRTIPADREDQRLAAVEQALARGEAVFITRPLSGVASRYALDALGPLVRVTYKGQDGHPDPPYRHVCSCLPTIHLAGYGWERLPYHAPHIRVVLYWDVLDRPQEEYKVSARLVRADGSVIRAVDDVPVHNTYPTTFWSPGERVVDVYDVPEPERGKDILVILYRAHTGEEVARVTLPYEEGGTAMR